MSNTAFSIAKEVRAHFFFSENGGRCLSRAAFPHGCMLGLHLHLPRALGVRSVEATLTDPSGRGKMPLSFTLVGTHGGLEEYAALLDTGASGLGLGAVSLAITLMCPFGKLFVSERVGQSLVFRSDACGSVAFLLFRTAGEGSGGGVFLLPYEELRHTGAICRGEDGDYDRFFAYLAAHGVHLLLLCLPIGGDAREKEGALSLSPDVRAAAEAHGVACLFDLLPFVSLHKEGRLQAPGDPVGYRLCDEPGGAFPPIEIADPMPPERLCGEGGVLARLLDNAVRQCYNKGTIKGICAAKPRSTSREMRR